MEVRITGRHSELDDEFKQYALQKFESLARISRHARSVECVFDEVSIDKKVELIAHLTRGKPIAVHARHEDQRACFDAAYAKLERVLIRLKEKLETRRHSGGPVMAPEGPVSEELKSFDEVLAELAGEED